MKTQTPMKSIQGLPDCTRANHSQKDLPLFSSLPDSSRTDSSPRHAASPAIQSQDLPEHLLHHSLLHNDRPNNQNQVRLLRHDQLLARSNQQPLDGVPVPLIHDLPTARTLQHHAPGQLRIDSKLGMVVEDVGSIRDLLGAEVVEAS